MNVNGVNTNGRELSRLALEVLSDHERAPEAAFYDLLRLGKLFSSNDVTRLDEAYKQLEDAGFVERIPNQSVAFGGNNRPVFRPADASHRSTTDE